MALFNDEGTLFSTSQVVPPTKMNTEESIYFIASRIQEFYPQVQKVAIEDVYYSPKRVLPFKVLSRLAGAIIFTCIDHFKVAPTFYTATNARKLVGLAPDIAKVQTQLWVLEKFYPHIAVDQFHKAMELLRKDYVKRKLTKSQWDYRLTKLSKEVAEATDISNDKADAVVVGLAYLIKNKIIGRPK